MKKKLNRLFENLCCSKCRTGFDENSIEIMRAERGLLVTHLTCKNCGQSFGVAFLGIDNIALKNNNDNALEVINGPEPISYDDVIDAHRFIQNLDGNWQKHLPS